MSNEKIESKNETPQIVHKHLLKKQLTYSCGMKLNIDDVDNKNMNNKLYRSQEVENLTAKQEQENEMLNQDADALNYKSHLKRTSEHESLQNSEVNNE
jgi:hypothetical protein